ncbi:MAG: four helix bundle protein [Candidatus Uhrbacteria bacterium]|nr:four helix bundle protein [Candidatus Uhrbacteria bacterium]
MKKKPYHDNFLWQRSDAFVKLTYAFTKDFPKEELYGIISQLRRAALSVPLNVVEGNARSSTKELIRFLIIARGSLAECSYLLELSRDLGYLSEEKYNNIEYVRNHISYLLQQSLNSLSR